MVKTTKRNEVQPSRVSVLRQHSSKSHVFRRLRNDRSDGSSLTAGGRLFHARAAVTGKCTVTERRASGRPNHQSQRVSGSEMMFMSNPNPKFCCHLGLVDLPSCSLPSLRVPQTVACSPYFYCIVFMFSCRRSYRPVIMRRQVGSS